MDDVVTAPAAVTCDLIIVASLTAATGNNVTAARLAKVVERALSRPPASGSLAGQHFRIVQQDCNAFTDDHRERLCSARFVLCLHAYRACRSLLTYAPSPARECHQLQHVIVILGGTDVNEYGCRRSASYSPEKAAVMLRAFLRARAIVAFTPALRDAYYSFIDSHVDAHAACRSALHSKARLVPQGVDVEDDDGGGSGARDAGLLLHASDTRTWDRTYTQQLRVSRALRERPESLRAQLGVPHAAIVLLLPCGLRPVKAPLFLVDAVREWRCARPDVHLVIVGPPLDDACAAAVRRACGTDGVWYAPPVPRSRLLQWTQEADVLLNTSASEGMSNALLEAMALGTPVAARRNDGNSELLQRGELGELFDTPAEGVAACKRILETVAAGDGLMPWPPAERAHAVVRSLYSLETEVDRWAALLRECEDDGARESDLLLEPLVAP